MLLKKKKDNNSGWKGTLQVIRSILKAGPALLPQKKQITKTNNNNGKKPNLKPTKENYSKKKKVILPMYSTCFLCYLTHSIYFNHADFITSLSRSQLYGFEKQTCTFRVLYKYFLSSQQNLYLIKNNGALLSWGGFIKIFRVLEALQQVKTLLGLIVKYKRSRLCLREL